MSRENCECLAFWVDSEPCICGEQIGPPMEVGVKKLQAAERLARLIRRMDHELEKLAKEKPYCRTLVYTGVGSGDPLELRLPPDIAAGLIRTMRFHALIELSQTGVVTTWSGHRPVV